MPRPCLPSGHPGGNTLQAILYDTARVSLSTKPVGGALDAISATAGPGGTVQLNLRAGRIDSTNPAFDSSRKPLAVEFTVDGHQIIVVSNHFNSKGGDQLSDLEPTLLSFALAPAPEPEAFAILLAGLGLVAAAAVARRRRRQRV